MKKTETLLGSVLVALAVTTAAAAALVNCTELHVTMPMALLPQEKSRTLYVDGNRKSQAPAPDGSEKRPFRTIQQAADVALPGDTIYIKAGTYRETVIPPRSGEPGKPITFRPFQNDRVVISGADPVSGWKPGNKGIWQAPLAGDYYRSALHYADQVFVDGRMMTLARWPNLGPDISRPKKAESTRFVSKSRGADNWTTAVFEDSALAAIPDGLLTGAEIVVQPNHDAWSWTLSGTIVSQKGTTITLRSRNDGGQDGGQSRYHDRSRYYAVNKRELLDAPGEWFHDTAQGVLYLMPLPGDAPDRQAVEVRKRDYAFDLDGKSYITVQGLRLFACTITTDHAAGTGTEYDETGKDLYPWRGKGGIASANHIVLDGLRVRYPSHYTDMSGHFFLQWGQNTGLIVSGSDCIVRNCTVRYSAGHGIVTLGQRNQIVGNLIEDVSYNQSDCAGISTGGAADSFDQEIAYNTIRRCGRSGITPRNLRNADPRHLVARIHHNDISEVMLQDHDGGAIYGVGDGTFTRIDHNWCHGISGFTASGIYPDMLTNWIIDHNVVWDVEWGVHLQNNGPVEGNALCYNNTLLVQNTSGATYGPFGFGNNANKGKGDYLGNNLVVCTNPEKSPGYKPISGSFEEAEIGENLFWDNVPGSATDPRWESLAKQDFRLRSGSPAIDKGKAIPAFVRGGITVPAFNDPIVGSAPDLGAYEYAAPTWRAGSALTDEDAEWVGKKASQKR